MRALHSVSDGGETGREEPEEDAILRGSIRETVYRRLSPH